MYFFTNLLGKEEITKIIKEKFLSESFIEERINKVRSSFTIIRKEAYFKNDLFSICINNKGLLSQTEHIFISPITNEIIEELTRKKIYQKDNINEMEKLLSNLFLTFNGWVNGRRFIYRNIRNYIINYFSDFFKYISKQISNYFKITKNNLKKLDRYYKNAIGKTNEFLNNSTKILGLKPFKLLLFGSYENKLNIEGSDRDFTIYCDEKKFSKNDLSKVLYNLFKGNMYVEKCAFYEKNSLITIQYINNKNMIKDKYKYLEDIQKKPKYYENRPSILRNINVDINITCNEKEYNKKDEINKIIKQYLENYPLLKQVIILLKRLLHINFLDKHYFGGISSFGLLNLCIHLIENDMIPFPKFLKSGELAFLFFIKYSNFDFYNKIVAKEDILKENPSNAMLIRKFYFSSFKYEKDFESAYTPKRKIYKEYSDGYILGKCKQLFQKSYELIRQEYKIFCNNKQNIKLTKENGISFVLKLFHLMTTENLKEN